MFATLSATVPRDRELPERAWRMECLRRVRDGEFYDHIPNPWSMERNGAGEYVPLTARRPSVRTGLCRVVVEDSAAFLFGEGRFPAVECDDKAVRGTLGAVVKDSRLAQAMYDAAIRGSIGSVVVLMRVLGNRLYWSALDTVYLTPEFQPTRPDVLARLSERYKVRGQALRERGYDVPDDKLSQAYWFERVWDDLAETWYLPRLAADKDAPRVVDSGRSVTHQLGFCPAVWVRNLAGGADPDGACTFRPAIETVIEIDYQLSQAGRGLKYSSDPLLLIREPAAPGGGEIIKGAGNALVVSADGDAKMLEIGGTAAAAVIEYVRVLREAALESVHGNRSTPDRMHGVASGRALEMLHQPMVMLADRLRSSYGEDGLLALLGMIVQASQVFPLQMRDGTPVGKLRPGKPIGLRWPGWFPPNPEDDQAQAGTLVALRNGGLLSRETAVGQLAAEYDIQDVAAELARIQADDDAADARAAAQTAAINATETVPS